MFERPAGGERAILVHIELTQQANGHPAEFAELAASAGVATVATLTARRARPDPKYFIGEGKAEELKTYVLGHEAEVVLFDQELSPAQERNLERLLSCRVVDRTGVILDIFAQRARSFEGKLQVEMAQLKHLSTRLVRGWTHLERQRGGIGLRGPGETQLETDRRLLGNRLKQLTGRLGKVRRQRQQGARARRRANLSLVSLVGYTNAGKSTLFNLLTHGGTYAADQLFATLDTTLRRMNVAGEHPVLVSDTVGFIRNLPPELIASFHATLDETKDATLLLHVIDCSSEEMDMQQTEVRGVLARIGADITPVIEVCNKIDLLAEVTPRVERGQDGMVQRVWLSAHTGAGVELLKDAIAERLNQAKTHRQIYLPSEQARLRAQLYEIGAVLREAQVDTGGWSLDVAVVNERLLRMLAAAGISLAADDLADIEPVPAPLADALA